MSLQTIFIAGLPPVRVDRARGYELSVDGWLWAYSLLLVCPICHSQWAVLQFEEDAETHVQGAYCERCRPSADRVPGSLLSPFHYDPLLLSLPEPLLKRELRLTLDYLERKAR